MKGDGNTAGQTGLSSLLPNDLLPGDDSGPDRARSRRQRGKADPARTRGSWIISDDAKGALERCELFRDIDRLQLMEVSALVEESTFEPDEVLLHEGESAHYMFVVVEGHGIAQLKLNRGWISLGLVGPGHVAGWSSLLEEQVYPASVKALTPMRVARIETSGLRLLMNLEPGIGYPVHRRLSSIFHSQYQAALNAIRTSA